MGPPHVSSCQEQACAYQDNQKHVTFIVTFIQFNATG
jgi:hypothetical protein